MLLSFVKIRDYKRFGMWEIHICSCRYFFAIFSFLWCVLCDFCSGYTHAINKELFPLFLKWNLILNLISHFDNTFDNVYWYYLHLSYLMHVLSIYLYLIRTYFHFKRNNNKQTNMLLSSLSLNCLAVRNDWGVIMYSEGELFLLVETITLDL